MRAKNNWRGAALAIGLVVLGFGAYAGYLVYDRNQGRQIASDYRRVEALEKNTCFVPGPEVSGDGAIRELGSCTNPESSMRVTSTVTEYGSCPEGIGNGFLSTTRRDGSYGDRSVCVTTNLFIGRCYQQAETPTQLGLVDCDDVRRDTASYEVVTGRKYGSKADDACGPPPMRTYVQADREGVTCTRLY